MLKIADQLCAVKIFLREKLADSEALESFLSQAGLKPMRAINQVDESSLSGRGISGESKVHSLGL